MGEWGGETIGPDVWETCRDLIPAGSDTAYASSRARQALEEVGHRLFVKPPPPRPAVPSGFTLDDFAIDPASGMVTCPKDTPSNSPDQADSTSSAKPSSGTRAPGARARTVHQSEGRTGCNDSSGPRSAGRRPPPGNGRPRLAGRIPWLAPTGGTRRRLDRPARQPPPALPRHPQERHLAPHPSRHPEPAPPDQRRTHPLTPATA